MSIELIVAILSGVIALSSGGLTIWGQRRMALLQSELAIAAQERQQLVEREETFRPFREPLARAAYDLQSRLYNILVLGLIDKYLVRGEERERQYVLHNTVFLIAQYFAWTEIVRRKIQFIDLGESDATRKLSYLQDGIYSLWQTDQYPPPFRVFAGEQRAIGEAMLTSEGGALTCLGYGALIDGTRIAADPLLSALQADVTHLVDNPDAARPRLKALQNALIDLLDFLDPDYTRFPADTRTKVFS